MHLKVGEYLKIRDRGNTYRWSWVPDWIGKHCPQYTGKISYWEYARNGDFGTVIYTVPSTITPDMDICLFRTDGGAYFVFCADGLERKGE